MIKKIKAEIERLMKETDDSQFGIGGRCMCRIILDYINSLLEEKSIEKAEKDLALTWEDVQLLDLFALECQTEESKGRKFNSSQEFFEEVLRRFNKTKNE